MGRKRIEKPPCQIGWCNSPTSHYISKLTGLRMCKKCYNFEHHQLNPEARAKHNERNKRYHRRRKSRLTPEQKIEMRKQNILRCGPCQNPTCETGSPAFYLDPMNPETRVCQKCYTKNKRDFNNLLKGQ